MSRDEIARQVEETIRQVEGLHPDYSVVRLDPKLTVAQRFRLIEIAHETKDERVREAALEMLKRCMMAVPMTTVDQS
jgi:hypothetical protein